MMEAKKRSLQATALFVGSILGAGVFGLPYAFAQAGFPVGLLYLIVIASLLLILQLLITEVTTHTPGHRRLSGLAGTYLGPAGRWITAILTFGGMWGVLLAYTLLGGDFLMELLGPLLGGTHTIYALVFFAFEAALVFLPVRRAANFEIVIGGILLTLFVILMLAGIPEFSFANVSFVSGDNLFLPYGVVLFSLAGLGVAPEMHDIFGKRYDRYMPKSVIVGFAVLFLLYALFTFVVVGVTGLGTTPNALIGYTSEVDGLVKVIGSLVGLVTISSIFLMVGEQAKDTFIFDYKLSKKLAWFLTLIVPLILFLLGVREFIPLISFVGAVFSALLAVMLLLVYEKMRSTVCKTVKCFRVPRIVTFLIGIIFVLGAAYQIIQTFFV